MNETREKVKKVRGRPRRPRSAPIGDHLASEGLPDRLRAAIDKDGRSDREIARVAGLSYGGLRRILEPGSRPGIDSVERLARALVVPPSWLAFG